MRMKALLGLVLLLVLATPLAADVHERRIVMDIQGESVALDFLLSLPEDFDPVAKHPVLVVFAEDDQELRDAREALTFWQDAADEQGWVLVSPAAPRGILFHEGAYMVFDPLADHLRGILNVHGGRFHLAGGKTGSYSAYQVGMYNALDAASLTTWGGVPPFHDRPGGLNSMGQATKYVYIGEEDDFSRKQLEFALTQAGPNHRAETITVPGPRASEDVLNPRAMLARIERGMKEAAPPTPTERELSGLLNELHRAAAEADGTRYFSLFAPDAVFFGTDPSERWTLKQLQAYASPRFLDGSGWKYVPTRRAISYEGNDPETVWFDETLHNARYGRCRGTGSLRKIDGEWKIEHYNLSIPIPNAITPLITEQIGETPVNDVQH